MRARTLAVGWSVLFAGCGAGSRESALCLADRPENQGGLESCDAVLLPQLDPRPGDPDNLICTWGRALNASGVITGETCDDEGFVWSSDAPAGSPLRFSFPVAARLVSPFDINSAGDIVGLFSPTENPFRVGHPFLLTGGTLTVLPRVEETFGGAAVDINDEGTVVGWSETSTGPVAVYWQQGEVHRIEGIDEMGGDYAVATAINENGTIVGVTNTIDLVPIQAFRWPRGGALELLPALFEGDVGDPHDVNDAGVMVGRAGTPEAESLAVYWDEDGDIHELPRLHDTPHVEAVAISNDGVIVGHEMSPEFITTEARLWLDGEVYDLEDLVPALPEEYELIRAEDINDDGEVVAHASVADGGPIRHVTLLLKPDLDDP
jgi:hypothetical protein